MTKCKYPNTKEHNQIITEHLRRLGIAAQVLAGYGFAPETGAGTGEGYGLGLAVITPDKGARAAE